MNIQQAIRLLGILPEDDERELKRKYHKLISQFHPDSLNDSGKENDHLAQEINEAYRVLSQSGEWRDQYIKKNDAAYQRHDGVREPQKWSGEQNKGAFIPRNIYLHYSMELSEEARKAATEKMFYQAARGRYMWDPEEEDFPLFLTSLRHASAELLEKIETNLDIDLSSVPDLKEYRFRVQAKLFEYLSMEYVNPVQALDSLTEPESTDGKGQRIYKLKAFLAAETSTAEGRSIAGLQPGEYLFPRAFHGNQIQVMNKTRQTLGYLHMEDDRLYFCIIPLLKKQAAQVKLLVRGEEAETVWGNNRNRTYRRAQGGVSKVNVDFYFRLEDENYIYNCADLNLKIGDLLAGYEKYLGSCSPGRDRFDNLFERLSRSNFRSRFHLKEKDLQYIQEKGMDTIRSHARDFVRMRLAPAQIPNDGKQTPMRGHPVFLAQHATGCCCRGCLYKWHRIPAGVQLTGEQQEYVVDVLMEWIEREYKRKQ